MPNMQLLTASIEAAINQALSWASNSSECLSPLNNKRCIIYIQEIKKALIFSFQDEKILVGADEDAQYTTSPDDDPNVELSNQECWVSISVFAIDKLKQNSQLTKLIKAGQLDFAGDLSILQGMSALFNNIDLDIEDVLSKYIGDAAAYQTNTSAKKAFSFLKNQFTLFSQTMADAALDEKPIGVRKIMLVNFSDDVNLLSADVDRFEAKVTRLEDITKVKSGS